MVFSCPPLVERAELVKKEAAWMGAVTGRRPAAASVAEEQLVPKDMVQQWSCTGMENSRDHYIISLWHRVFKMTGAALKVPVCSFD